MIRQVNAVSAARVRLQVDAVGAVRVIKRVVNAVSALRIKRKVANAANAV